MNIIEKSITEIKAYDKNPRKNDTAVEAVANSIREFGFKVPIIIDKDNVIVCGHTRLKAAKKLGLKQVPCIVADDLTDEQIKAFRLADNKVGELAEWDFNLLDTELSEIFDIDMEQFGFEKETEEETDDKYTDKTNIPQYEIVGGGYSIKDLVDTTKSEELKKEIELANVPEDIKEFLRLASYRHNVFDYRKIAEYYAEADKTTQELFEKSALVIIDIDNAIANGYVKLDKAIKAIVGDNDER